MRRNSVNRWVSLFAVTMSLYGAMLCPAAPINFASFTTGPGNNFAYVNDGVDSYLTTRDTASGNFSVSLPISFEYQVANTYGATLATIPAKLTFQATVAAPVTGQALPGGLTMLSENLADVSMSIVADVPVNGHTNLLTMTSTVGTCSGLANGQTLSLRGNEGSSEKVTFTSDFLPITLGLDEGYTFTFTAVTPKVTTSGGYLSDLNFHGEAVFAAPPTSVSVPEPASVLLMLGGLLALKRRK